MSIIQGKNIVLKREGDGAVELKQGVSLELSIANSYGYVENVRLIMYKHGESKPKEFDMTFAGEESENSLFNVKFSLDEIGVYYYFISLKVNHQNMFISKDEASQSLVLSNVKQGMWKITVCRDGFSVPKWAKGAIMYHIFVDRFKRDKSYQIKENSDELRDRIIHEYWSEEPIWEPDEEGKIKNNDFFCGNLKGIESQMNYFKSLGVTILYLSPVWESQSNHRYDTGDYEIVDPYAGSNEDLKCLCDTAHKNGIRVILDTVFNHTGNFSKYFNADGRYKDSVGASQSKDSMYYNWYKNHNGEFEYWWGFKNLPVMNPDNPEWRKYLFKEGGVIDNWYDLGIDGLRLDVADELSDEFITQIRRASRRNKKDAFIIGEVWENAATKEKDGKTRKYLLGEGIDTAMNYPYTDAIFKFVRFGDYKTMLFQVNDITNDYPVDAANSVMNALATHDIPRALTTLQADGIVQNREWVWDAPDFGDGIKNRAWQHDHGSLSKHEYKEAKKKLKISVVIQYFLPGTVSIFYGDEVGLYGFRDPFNRKPYPWKKQDRDLLKFYKKIGSLRKSCSFLKDAKIKFVEANENVLVFERTGEKESLLTAVNRTSNAVKLNLPEKYKKGRIIFKHNGSSSNKLGAYGAIVIVL